MPLFDVVYVCLCLADQMMSQASAQEDLSKIQEELKTARDAEEGSLLWLLCKASQHIKTFQATVLIQTNSLATVQLVISSKNSSNNNYINTLFRRTS